MAIQFCSNMPRIWPVQFCQDPCHPPTTNGHCYVWQNCEQQKRNTYLLLIEKQLFIQICYSSLYQYRIVSVSSNWLIHYTPIYPNLKEESRTKPFTQWWPRRRGSGNLQSRVNDPSIWIFTPNIEFCTSLWVNVDPWNLSNCSTVTGYTGNNK